VSAGQGAPTPQEEFWAGKFGSAYIERNRSPQLLASNLQFFSRALRRAGRARTCVGLGANIGMNLKALRLHYPGLKASGVEINADEDRELATVVGADHVHHAPLTEWEPTTQVDLAFVKGVLIHLNPTRCRWRTTGCTPGVRRPGAGDGGRTGLRCPVRRGVIDVRRAPDGALSCWSHSGKVDTGRDPVEWAREVAERGAGEILLTSIDRDGTMEGYDLDLVHAVASAVSVPVIASGGAGSYQHMVEAVRAGASASIFHFTEQTPAGAKQALDAAGVPVRKTAVR
jgi:hypothetical protein